MPTNDKIKKMILQPQWAGWHFVQIKVPENCNESKWLSLRSCIDNFVDTYLARDVQLHTVIAQKQDAILLLHAASIPDLSEQLSTSLKQCLARHKLALDLEISVVNQG